MSAKLTRLQVDLLTTASLLVALAGSYLRPEASWPSDLAMLSVIASLAAEGRLDPVSVRVRAVSRVWLAPILLVAMAVQLLVTAPAAELTRTVSFAVVLVVSASVLLWSRRRVS